MGHQQEKKTLMFWICLKGTRNKQNMIQCFATIQLQYVIQKSESLYMVKLKSSLFYVPILFQINLQEK